ncbi:MAG: hypothetical protein V4638_05475 [Bacteroidota bacterium]
MISKLFLLLFASLIIFQVGYSQVDEASIDELIKNGSEQKLVSENSRYMQEDYFYFANKIAVKLIEINATSCNYNYRKGYGALYSEENPVKAKANFEIAIQNTSASYDAYSKKEKTAPYDAFYHYAVCLHKLGEYDKAMTAVNTFKEKSRKESELLPKADMLIVQINNAKASVANNITIKNVTELNSEYPEFTSNLSLDGKMLFLTARRPWENGESDPYRDRRFNFPTEDGYYAINKNGSFSNPIRMKNSNPKFNESHLTVDASEREMFFYSDSTGSGDIYFGKVARDISNPTIEDGVTSLNTEFWETHAIATQDQNTVYFVSDRPGGLGGRDIYRVDKDVNGVWSAPINLGAPINSIYDEDAPFLSYDGKIMYFSNNGDKSIGGFDIFYSRLESENKWGAPVNMGAPLNSTYDDVFYNTSMDGKAAFLSSNRSGGKGNLDIYQIGNITPLTEIAVFKGIIKTSTGEPLPEDVKLDFALNCPDCTEKDKKMTLIPNLRAGEFFTPLEPCRSFQASMYNVGNSEPFQQETFITGCDLSYQEVVREFIYDMEKRILVPVEVEVIDTTPIAATFENVEFMHYFEYNKNSVTAKDQALNAKLKIVDEQLAKGREKVTINIYSSASTVPTTKYSSNDQLAQLRAENLQKELNNYYSTSQYKNKVNVKIIKVIVDGPAYQKDAQNKGKYKPYQFVGIKTE